MLNNLCNLLALYHVPGGIRCYTQNLHNHLPGRRETRWGPAGRGEERGPTLAKESREPAPNREAWAFRESPKPSPTTSFAEAWLLNATCLHIQSRKKFRANKRKKPLTLSDTRKELIPILDKAECKWRAGSCPMSRLLHLRSQQTRSPLRSHPFWGYLLSSRSSISLH